MVHGTALKATYIGVSHGSIPSDGKERFDLSKWSMPGKIKKNLSKVDIAHRRHRTSSRTPSRRPSWRSKAGRWPTTALGHIYRELCPVCLTRPWWPRRTRFGSCSHHLRRFKPSGYVIQSLNSSLKSRWIIKMFDFDPALIRSLLLSLFWLLEQRTLTKLIGNH